VTGAIRSRWQSLYEKKCVELISVKAEHLQECMKLKLEINRLEFELSTTKNMLQTLRKL
jgi:hypothetical protein